MDSDKVVTYANILKRDADDSEALAKPTLKKHKEIDISRNDIAIKNEIIKNQQMNSDILEILLKKMDDMSNRLNVVTDFVEKQQQKDSDLPVTSMKKKKSPKEKKKVVKYKCGLATNDYKMKNRRTIFVQGFDCSFPLEVIKRKLTEHFSSCGEVAMVYLPHHCKTDSPIGYAFINMRNDEKEALKLDGTRFDGMYLEVTMAYGRSEYNSFTNRRGCKRCLRNIMKRRMEDANSPIRKLPRQS
uniref:Nucleolin 2 n=2 Tax=Noccaea caerulescens TaxID=107243 RepID=A0A1J3CV51_NOCCA